MKIFCNSQSVRTSMVFKANTRNKKNCTTWKAMKKWAEENDAFSCVTFCMRSLRWWSLLNTTTDNLDRDNSSDLWGCYTLQVFSIINGGCENNACWHVSIYMCVCTSMCSSQKLQRKSLNVFLFHSGERFWPTFFTKKCNTSKWKSILFTFSHLLSSLEVKF